MGRRKSSSLFRKLSAADENIAVVKSVPGKLQRIRVMNDQAAIVYLKLYDKASAPAATDTPMSTVQVLADNNVDINYASIGGIGFDKGLGMRLVTGIADNDATAPAAANAIVELVYD